jgi:hypothetical protein
VARSSILETPYRPLDVLFDRWRVGLIGSREFDDFPLVFRTAMRLIKTHGRLVAVSGGAEGADAFARTAFWSADAHFCNLSIDLPDGATRPLVAYRPIDPPDFGAHRIDPVHFVEFPIEPGPQSHGARAFLRNMRVVGAIDELFAFYARGPNTRGTASAIKEALQKGISVWEYKADRGWLHYEATRDT